MEGHSSHPKASSPLASSRMRKVRQRGTKRELEIRSALHKIGMRFRVQITPLEDLRRQADIAFRREKIAIFIDGCFWHGCPIHRTLPKSNTEWWTEKLQANIRRDEDTNLRLREAGWLVLRFWEHEETTQIVQIVQRCLKERRTVLTSSN
jgi:DNA mismatch endonuclease (patch repair protein)